MSNSNNKGSNNYLNRRPKRSQFFKTGFKEESPGGFPRIKTGKHNSTGFACSQQIDLEFCKPSALPHTDY